MRPRPRPSQVWLELHKLTHAGQDTPYEEPETDPIDDPEANAIVPAGGPEDKQENTIRRGRESEAMDLTEAFSRLTKARPSLGLPPISTDSGAIADGDLSFGSDGQPSNEQDLSYQSNDDSFAQDISFDDNRTVNLTKLRLSMGGQSVVDEMSMDLTGIQGDEDLAPSAEENTSLQSNAV